MGSSPDILARPCGTRRERQAQISAERIMISLNDETRKSMLDTLDALRQWSNEIGAVNDRCLPKVIDHMATAQRAMGWPDYASTTTGISDRMHYFLLFTVVRETLQKARKLESEVIDKVAEACFASRLM